MSRPKVNNFCSIVHLSAFTAWLVARGFEALEINEQDEFYRARRGASLICVMPRAHGRKFTVNVAERSWLEQFKKTLQPEVTK